MCFGVVCCEHCFDRYKSLCPSTWPSWHGVCVLMCVGAPSAHELASPVGQPRDGVRTLVQHLGYTAEQFKAGKYAHTHRDVL